MFKLTQTEQDTEKTQIGTKKEEFEVLFLLFFFCRCFKTHPTFSEINFNTVKYNPNSSSSNGVKKHMGTSSCAEQIHFRRM